MACVDGITRVVGDPVPRLPMAVVTVVRTVQAQTFQIDYRAATTLRGFSGHAPARLPDDIEIVRALFAEYIRSLGIDLSFQGVDAELAQLPGKYASPRGVI